MMELQVIPTGDVTDLPHPPGVGRWLNEPNNDAAIEGDGQPSRAIQCHINVSIHGSSKPQ
jgi:hypothetical protein